jgi:hypothetical protein
MKSADARKRAIILAAEVRTALSSGAKVAPRDAAAWAGAISHFLELGEFDAARYVARRVATDNPNVAMNRSLQRVLDILPPLDRQLPFTNRGRKEVQIVARPGARTAILVFSDVNRSVGLPFATVHRWFGRLDATVIYLRDRRDLWFVNGLRWYGWNRTRTVQRLRRIITRTGAERIVCYGNSSGGFSALHYAIDLGADAVVSMAGRSEISTLTAKRWLVVRERAEVKNLRTPLIATPRPPQVLMVRGEGAGDDRIQADNIADLPSVQVGLVKGFEGHAVAVELMCRGQFGSVLDWMMAATPGHPQPAPSMPQEPW